MKAALCSAVILACVALVMAGKSTELYGHVYYSDKTPAPGVVLSIGNYSVTSEQDGSYRMTFLRPGSQVVLVKPPGKDKVTRPFRVTIKSEPTLKDFLINW